MRWMSEAVLDWQWNEKTQVDDLNVKRYVLFSIIYKMFHSIQLLLYLLKKFNNDVSSGEYFSHML